MELQWEIMSILCRPGPRPGFQSNYCVCGIPARRLTPICCAKPKISYFGSVRTVPWSTPPPCPQSPGPALRSTRPCWIRFRPGDVHVRTSNADGLFLAHGLEESRLSTPQGAYRYLQCLANCRSDAVIEAARKVVIMELGVEMSTPGVLGWENEELVEEGEGKIKVIRVELGDTALVPAELEKMGLATSVEGDLNDVLRVIQDREA
ncbi:uncharacterized protein BO97DRAFT_429619 [Aspergillus homomorphus CBS 101889]|uniref:Uncharacterized protein n=1 Tax=Aspergillus homomorphus (strain CBS 101889) TaxID=1450537 RepID=A0A395HI29_ASPHC|nr:hypothetical protein BO97DRAFT_429619 [Aspergillus homomorphus CBS 101889]RAL07163.1 hypothetical protein BO97DRAFT_429619 [Aspergillus homomorphus CBS 101889]